MWLIPFLTVLFTWGLALTPGIVYPAAGFWAIGGILVALGMWIWGVQNNFGAKDPWDTSPLTYREVRSANRREIRLARKRARRILRQASKR